MKKETTAIMRNFTILMLDEISKDAKSTRAYPRRCIIKQAAVNRKSDVAGLECVIRE